MSDATVSEHLRPLLEVLRRVYPHGLKERDYLPLLDFLQFSMSERSLATLVAAFTGRQAAAVAADSARLSDADSAGAGMLATGRVADRLRAHGWGEALKGFAERETQARISPLPGDLPDYVLESLAVLRRAYPDGIPQTDYLPLLATLTRDCSHRGLSEIVGAYTGRHYMSVYNDIGGIRDDPATRRDADRIWQRLLDNGWIPETPSDDDDWPPLRL